MFLALISGNQAAQAYRILPRPGAMQAYPAPTDAPRLAAKSTFQMRQRNQESRNFEGDDLKSRHSPLRAPRMIPRSPVERSSAQR